MLRYYIPGSDGTYDAIDEPLPAGRHLIISENLTRSDVTHLTNAHGLSEHLISDVFDVNELPRAEVENGYQYIFIRNSEPTKDSVASHPVLFILGNDLLACISAKKDPASLIAVESPASASLQRLLINGIFAVAKNYETIIDTIGTTIHSIEQRMRRHEAANDDFYRFVTIESNLVRARMSLSGLKSVAEKITPTAATKTDRNILDDICLFAGQLIVEIDSHSQTIKSIRETYSTVANNTLNQRMKLLTALTLLLAIPNLFYSMYGMNLSLPFMHEPWTYPVLVGFTILLVAIIYSIGRRKRFF